MKLLHLPPSSIIAAACITLASSWLRPSSFPPVALAYSGSYYPKAHPPQHLYVIKDSAMNAVDEEMKATIATLQGLLAKSSQGDQIWVDAEYGGYSIWLEYMASEYGVTHETVPNDDPYWLLSHFSSRISGYIKYQRHGDGDGGDSANVATSLASYYNAIMVEEDLVVPVAAALGPTAGQQVFDATPHDEAWVLQQAIYDQHLSKDIVLEVRPIFYVQLRDYAVLSDAFVFHDSNLFGSLRSAALQRLDPDSPVLGWAEGDESTFVGLTSDEGRFMIPADHAHNLAPLSGIPESSLTQVALNNYVIPVEESGVHYVTFVLSDGDNVQWLLGEHASDSQQRWWSNPHRGEFGVGYGLPPSMIDLAPAALKWYYENATSNDVFMVGPSGGGYMYPSRYPDEDLDLHLQRLDDYMGRCDLGLVEVIDFGSLYNTVLWDKYTVHDNTDAIIYLEYSSHKAHTGKLRWSRGKPIITPRYIVSTGSEQEVIDAINAAPRDPSSSDAYSLIFIHGWSENLNHMKTVTDGLDASVRVVTPKAMADLIQRNVLPDQLFEDDFEGGLDGGWISSGDVTTSGSVKIGEGGVIERTFSTGGRYSVRVGFDMATSGLNSGDAIMVELYDGSLAWSTVMTMELGAAETDGNMHSFVYHLSAASDDGSITLRFSVVAAPSRQRGRTLQKCASSGVEAKACSGQKGNLPKNCCAGLVCSGDVCAVDPPPNPSSSPTKRPTGFPTSSPVPPTSPPTVSPTQPPTHQPTQPPTNPTNSPTISPTNFPSVPPTKSPSLPPTKNPTASPSTFPSVSPTKAPSVSPTKTPTIIPTDHPTKSPSAPTKSPSSSPTDSPTTSPSVSPTKITPQPTRDPTASPTPPSSDAPSVSSHPSLLPSYGPSVSKKSSAMPSHPPSISTAPSCHPSLRPSESAKPSPRPTELAVFVDNVVIMGFPITDSNGPWIFEAESNDFGHKMGSVSSEGDGWTVDPNLDNTNDHMLFGPYTGLVPVGSRTATYRIKRGTCVETCGCGCIFCLCQTCSSECAASDDVVLLDINANTANGQQVVGNLQVNYGDFVEEGRYQDFTVAFNNDAITLEFRAFYQGTVSITVDKVTIQ